VTKQSLAQAQANAYEVGRVRKLIDLNKAGEHNPEVVLCEQVLAIRPPPAACRRDLTPTHFEAGVTVIQGMARPSGRARLQGGRGPPNSSRKRPKDAILGAPLARPA
jgi:hypothetical protein